MCHCDIEEFEELEEYQKEPEELKVLVRVPRAKKR